MFFMQDGNIPHAVAIQQAQREITRMGHIASENIHSSVDCFLCAKQRQILTRR